MKEVVIKISDAMYKYITMEHAICIKEVGEYLFGLVRCTGTLLPKGHGDLIDADDVKENHKRWIGYLDEDMIARLNIAIDKYIPIIIEADKNRKTEKEKSGNGLKWFGKNCKDCGNEKCKKLGMLSKKYDCALWQARHAVLALKGDDNSE